MTGFYGISFVSQSRQTIGGHYFWVDSLSLKSKQTKKLYDEFLWNILCPLIPAKLLVPIIFGGSLILKSKQAKIFDNEPLRNLLSLPIPANYWRPLFPRYSLSIKKANALWLSQASGLLFFAWEAPLFSIILKARFHGPTYGGSLCIGFICGFYHLGKRHLAKKNRCRARY